MKSKANVKGHPIHPILICFPIAFFTGTLIFDILALVYEGEYAITAMYLSIGGIIGALAAAVPGIIDYSFTVPPDSTAKKRAAKHGLTNTTVLLIFTAMLLYRTRVVDANQSVIVGSEVIGEILLFIAGWMGGTLVYRNQIGVDPRYADAGKWKEEYFRQEGARIDIGNVADLKVNQMRLLHVNKRRIVLARTESGLAAFEDHCTHRGGSLAGGVMICGTVQCPWHGSQFDVRDGHVKAGPAKHSVQVYEVREENGKGYLII